MTVNQLQSTLQAVAEADFFRSRTASLDEREFVQRMFDEAARMAGNTHPQLLECLELLVEFLIPANGGMPRHLETGILLWAQEQLMLLAASAAQPDLLAVESQRVAEAVTDYLCDSYSPQAQARADYVDASTGISSDSLQSLLGPESGRTDQLQLLLEALQTSESDEPIHNGPPARQSMNLEQPNVPRSAIRQVSSVIGQSSSHGRSLDARPFPELERPLETIELDAELQEAFLDDALRCLAAMESSLLDWDASASDTPRPAISRELHTLKGATASCEMHETARLVHELEDWLDAQTAVPFAEQEQQLLLQAVDTLRRRTAPETAEATFTVRQPNGSEHNQFERIGAGTNPVAGPDSGPRTGWGSGSSIEPHEQTMRVRSAQVDRLLDLAAELVIMHNRRSATLARLDDAQQELARLSARLRAVAEQTADLQVDEIASDIAQLTQSLRDLHAPLRDENESFTRIGRHVRQEVVEMRRQPVAGLFQRLQRAAADAARSEQKNVRLELNGAHSGLESAIQDRLYDPLLHLIRNAVSHGIETTDERLRLGKPATGRITLTASGNSHQLIIEVQDDGRGLDYEAIRRQGISRGLLTVDQEPSESDLARLIFRPGFSTRQSATAISGRGVGMDVVWNTLQRLHSRIDVDSQPGRGTRIRVAIPLPNMIEHVVVVRTGGQLWAIPLHQITRVGSRETILGDLQEESHATISLQESIGFSSTSDVPGISAEPQAILLTGRHQQPALTSASVDQDNQTRPATSTPPGDAGMRIALCVENIVGTEELVVRPLPPILSRHPFVMGTSLSGSGDIVMLLSCSALLESRPPVTSHPPADPERVDLPSLTDRPESALPATADSTLRVLLVDDSLSARRSIRRLLQRYSIECCEANDGLDALDHLRRQTFDLVISDLEMPRLNGLDLLAEINSMPAESQPVSIIISSRDDLRDTVLRNGACAFLSKPVTDSDLSHLLNHLDIPSVPDLAAGVTP